MTFDEVLGTASQMLTDEELNSILREKYPGPNGALRLAQNLISIFGAEHPNGQTIRGPISVVQPDSDTPAFNVIPFPNANVPATNIGGGGGLSPAQTTFPSPPDPAALAPSFPVMLYGIVQSGTGNNYVVRCWITNPGVGAALGDFPCYQGQIDPAETIPAGTHCFVWCAVAAGNVLGGFRMTVPVFLA